MADFAELEAGQKVNSLVTKDDGRKPLGPQDPLVARRLRTRGKGDAAASAYEALDGKRMHGTMTAACPHTTFAKWAGADSEGPLELSNGTSMNCGESVLVAAYHAKKVSWQEIHDWYMSHWSDSCNDDSDKSRSFNFHEHWTPGAMKSYSPKEGVRPEAGDLVYLFATDGSSALDGGPSMDHVMMATGEVVGNEESECMSFNYGSDTQVVQKTTIEKLLREEEGWLKKSAQKSHERMAPEDRQRLKMLPDFEQDWERRRPNLRLPEVKFATPTWNRKK